MKKIKLLLFLALLAGTKNLHAAETEPNNSKTNANVLTLNGSNTGAIDVSGDEDWWRVATNADGKLSVTITVSNGKTLRCYIYDNDGTTLINSGYSSVTATVNADGLAEGIYYIKLIAYTNGQLPVYTISDMLTLPAENNDVEPNNLPAQAKVLPLNGSKKGHVGYYYNIKRDTADWYKITTNADGLLRLTLQPANGTTTRIYLYDNDGTTLLNSSYSSTKAVLSQDGLATGTYYAKVICYNTTQFAPYTLSDSLFIPAQSNDAEPNNTVAQAKVLPLNGNKTGHMGYYYNLKRDTADWYKITANADGLLRLTLQPANGTTTRIYLYDNDGTTLLNSSYSSIKAVVSEDGLAAGTYYAKVICYNTAQFAPYTLSDSLFTYINANDDEPNSYASQAKTIPANEIVTGHTGFYYNNERDTADWWKINYTGSGNLSFTINQETLNSGGTNTLRFQVYKDTAASPLHSSYSSSTSRIVNLTALTKGYYWIKIYTYNSADFSSYSLTNNFTQVNIAKIKPAGYDTSGICASTNSITFQCSSSLAPYTIQLYRFGVAYGNPVITKKKTTFNNLPAGSYYATCYGDGATGNAFGKSKNVSIEPIPSGLKTTAISNIKAKLNWSNVECADYFIIHYKVHGTGTWINKKTKGNVASIVLNNLAPNTVYDWTVASVDSANGITATGAFADSISFTTASSFIADADNEEENIVATSKNNGVNASVAPNPVNNYFIIHHTISSQQKLIATLYNINGTAVWTSGLMSATALNGKQVMASEFRSGFYYLEIMNEQGAVLSKIKVSVVK